MGKMRQVNHLNREIYMEDEIRFHLLSLAAEQETAKMYTDQRHVVICQVNRKTPIWIWTHEQVSEEELNDLRECLYSKFNWKSYTTLMVKPELVTFANLIVEDKLHEKCRIRTEMMSYKWRFCEYSNERIGHMEQANMAMVERVAELRARDINEMEHLGVSVTDLKKEAAWMIQTGNTYVWITPEVKIASLAFVAHEFPTQARINRVYTHPYQRRKGFGSMLMHELALKIHKEGKVAMLYSDATYLPSNGTYKKSGFIEQGKVYEIGI